MEKQNSLSHQVLDIEEYERLVATSVLSDADSVTVIMPAEEYKKKRENGTLPNLPIMQSYDLRPGLDAYRRIEKEMRQEERESSVCGKLSNFVRTQFRRIF